MSALRRIFLALSIAAPVTLLAIDEPVPTEAPQTSPEADDPLKLREMIDTMNQSNLQEAFRLLTRDYIQNERLDELEINRAALQGMLDRLDFGAMLLTEKSLSARNSPFLFYSSRIDKQIAYLRFGRYNEKGLADLDIALQDLASEKELQHLIVDLRSPQAQADFAIAAQILSRFRPPNELLFKIRRPNSDRPTLFISKPAEANWSRNLVLLVDRETGNVGEIIAAVLKRETGCLVLGETTPGLTVEYRDVAIGEDRILRYAIAEVVLEDDSSLFETGIEPDLVTPTETKIKHDIYRETQRGTELTSYLFQKQRPRMNEAALVAGTDPEIDYYILRSSNKPTPWDKEPPLDRTLQQAVDLLQTTQFLEGESSSRR